MAADDTSLKVRKVLELERNKKYQDSAVIGGLDGLLATLLEGNGLAKNTPLSNTLRSLPDNGYRSLSPNDRRLWITTALAALSGAGPAKAPTALRPRVPRVEVPG